MNNLKLSLIHASTATAVVFSRAQEGKVRAREFIAETCSKMKQLENLMEHAIFFPSPHNL